MTATLTVDLDAFTGADAYGGTPAAITLEPMTRPFAAGGKTHVGVVQVVLDALGVGSTPLVAGVVYRTVLDGRTLYVGPLTDGTTVDLSDPSIISNTPPDLPGGSGSGGSLAPVSTNTTTPAGTLGALVGYYAQAAVTINGQAVASGDWIVFAWDGTEWAKVGTGTLGATGGGSPTDTTPPTAGTLDVATATTGATLTVTGALDETALHATPYAYSSDGGTTWTAWQAGASREVTGLVASTSYGFRHKVRDAAGNEKLGATVTKSTAAPPSALTVFSQESFERPDGTMLNGLTPQVGPALVASAAAGCYGGIGQSTAAAGVWQPQATLDFTLPATAKRIKVTYGYQLGNTNSLVYVDLMTNTARTNYLSAGVSGTATTYSLEYSAASGWTTTVSPTAPTIPLSGTATVEWIDNAGDYTLTLSIGGVLHTTWTMSVAQRSTAAITTGLRLSTGGYGALGATAYGFRDYTIEWTA